LIQCKTVLSGNEVQQVEKVVLVLKKVVMRKTDARDQKT